MLQDAERFLSTAQFSHFIVKIQTFGRRSPEEMCVAPRVSAADGCPTTTMADYGGLSTPGPWPPAAIHVTFKKMLSARSAGGRVARNDGQSSCFLGFDKKKSWNRSIWRWKSRRWAVSHRHNHVFHLSSKMEKLFCGQIFYHPSRHMAPVPVALKNL